MKKRILACLGIIVTLALLTGCSSGVSQAKYDSMVAERDAAQAKLKKALADLTAAQNKLASVPSTAAGPVQTTPTDISTVTWQPVTYVNKEYGFKLQYPSTWNITTRGTVNVPAEIQHTPINSSDTPVPGSWVSLIPDTSDVKYTAMSMHTLLTSFYGDAQVVTTGTTVLEDNVTKASYGEFYATIDTYPMHIYTVSYVDGNKWISFNVWTIEDATHPWDGQLMRQIAHTLNKATAAEIAAAPASKVSIPTTLGGTTTATTTATTTSSGTAPAPSGTYYYYVKLR